MPTAPSTDHPSPPCRRAATGRPTMLVAGAVLLLAAIGLILYGQTRPLARTFHGKLTDLLPPAPAGWTRTERPIADTPEMKQKIGELLSYDDGVFYDYTQGNLRLSVYVAYWQPGKMSSRLVAGHTPDVCWVGAGWQCTERGEVSYEPSPISGQRPVGGTPSSHIDPPARGRASYISDLQSPSSQLFLVRPEGTQLRHPYASLQGTLLSSRAPSPPHGSVPAPGYVLPPAESRTFTANGTAEYVWFWHLVDGKPQSYGTGKQPPWHASLTDMLTGGFNQRPEQFFIRLSSPQPLDDLALSLVLVPVLQALPLVTG